MLQSVDCVEGDSELVEISREHFSLDSRVNVITDPLSTLVEAGQSLSFKAVYWVFSITRFPQPILKSPWLSTFELCPE